MITDTFHPNQAAALEALIRCYENGGKVLLCGNGGSAADCGHIAGELLKGFLKKRPVPAEVVAAVPEAAKLQCGLPAIDLTAHAAAITAVANDLGGELAYAQQVMAYGCPGDVIIGISTSGNAKNVLGAARAAKVRGAAVIGLTGTKESKLSGVADVTIRVPDTETYRIQEYHLPVYHWLCALVEEAMFEV